MPRSDLLDVRWCTSVNSSLAEFTGRPPQKWRGATDPAAQRRTIDLPQPQPQTHGSHAGRTVRRLSKARGMADLPPDCSADRQRGRFDGASLGRPPISIRRCAIFSHYFDYTAASQSRRPKLRSPSGPSTTPTIVTVISFRRGDPLAEKRSGRCRDSSRWDRVRRSGPDCRVL